MKISRTNLIFFGFLLSFCLLFIVVELLNGKLYTNDLAVYFGACNDFFDGKSPYKTSYGLSTGFFKYTPTTLFLFGTYTWTSFYVTKVIHLFILVLALIVSYGLLAKFILQKFKFEFNFGLLLLAFLTIATHIVRELHLGNINLILLVLFLLGIDFFKSGKKIGQIVCWGGIIILKPIVILILIPWLIKQEWKLMFSMGFLGIFFLILPLFYVGWNGNMLLWQDWFSAISEHGEYITSYNALSYLGSFYFSLPENWLLSSIFLIILSAFAFFDLHISNKNQFDLPTWSILFLAFTPNFFITDTQHFLLSLPLIFLLIYQLKTVKSIISWIIFGIGFFGFSLNSSDLWGKDFAHQMDVLGLLGLSNILWIGLFIFNSYYFNREIKTHETASLS
jgi:hypothetical protein